MPMSQNIVIPKHLVIFISAAASEAPSSGRALADRELNEAVELAD